MRPVSVFPFFGGGWKKELRTALLLLLGVLELSIRVDGIATKPHLHQAGFGLSFLWWGLEERTPNSAAFASGSTRAET